jgi:predicted nucleic acid-binding protein
MALAWTIEDEDTPEALRARNYIALYGAVVPSIWWLEIGHVLLVACRRRRMNPADLGPALQSLAALPIDEDGETSAHAWAETLALADTYRLSLYDAAYLEVAWRRVLPLATLDRALRRAAEAESVALF